MKPENAAKGKPAQQISACVSNLFILKQKSWILQVR